MLQKEAIGRADDFLRSLPGIYPHRFMRATLFPPEQDSQPSNCVWAILFAIDLGNEEGDATIVNVDDVTGAASLFEML